MEPIQIQCPGCAKTYRLEGTPPPTFTCRCGVTMDLAQFAPPPPRVPRAARAGRPTARGSDSAQPRSSRPRLEPEERSGSIERAATQNGVAGGVIAIAIAVVWFFVGLFFGRIFWFPAVLVVLGVIGIVDGQAKAGLAQRRARRGR